MVSPACTLVAEGVTVIFAAGVGVGVVLVLVVGVGVGVGVGSAGLDPLTELPPPEPVLLAVGVGVALAVAVGVVDAELLLDALGELAADVADVAEEPEVDGDAVADGEVAAIAVPVTPLEITKRPVARPTVTGRECADRMRTPCLCLWLL
jgi:hypothetical protein